MLELKNDDDDPHALEILIRHLYSIPTTSDTGSWESWLSVYQTANKFHEYDLSNEALDNLVKHALAKKDMSELAAIVKGVKTEAEECDNSLLAEYVARLIKPNVRERFKVHGFRRWLGGEKELMLAVIEELISD